MPPSSKLLKCRHQTPAATHDAGWWYRPEFIINELNINAAITQPVHEETVPLTPNPYTVRGYAYTG